MHSGMLRAARFVHGSVLPTLVAAAAHPTLRRYRVIFTGHSLGAGVAALGEGLRAATALETLDLSETQLDASGVEALGRATVAGGLQVLWS